MNISKFELATPSVVTEAFQEGSIILNLMTGEYFEIAEKAIPAFELVTSGKDVLAITAALAEVNVEISQKFSHFVEQVVGEKLIRPLDGPDVTFELADLEPLLSLQGEFILSRHKDLADLLAADPVHDVDHDTGELVKK